MFEQLFINKTFVGGQCLAKELWNFLSNNSYKCIGITDFSKEDKYFIITHSETLVNIVYASCKENTDVYHTRWYYKECTIINWPYTKANEILIDKQNRILVFGNTAIVY